MYNTSEQYKDAINNSNPSYLTGTITFEDGTTELLTTANIVLGGASITMQAVTGDVLEFGAAVLGELNIDIVTEESRYKYFNGVIDLKYSVETENGLESIPLGTWTISEAERDKRYLKITAYDNLLKLDIDYDLSTSGNAFEVMTSFAEDCGCELAEDEDYYRTLPNWEEFITINTDSGCSTYRQAVCAVAQMLGCFVQADRYGKISMRRFSTEETFRLSAGQRYSSTIADYHCQYVELQVTGLNGQYVAISENVESGLSMYMTDAPAWDYGVEEVLQQRTNNLLSYLETIHYTPCEFSTFSDPTIDCGDRVTLLTDQGEVETIITSYTWNYQGQMELQSVGKNPYLTGKNSKDQRMVRNLTQSVEAAKLIFYPFRNIKPVTLTEELEPVASVRFISTHETSVIFSATFQVEVQVDDVEHKTTLTLLDEEGLETVYEIPYKQHGFAELNIRYYYNSVDLGTHYTQTLSAGSHIISLYYVIATVKENSINQFAISMNINGGNAEIKKEMFRGAISGQGLAGTSRWDGTITVEEVFDAIPIADIKALPFGDSVVFTDIHREDAGSFTEKFGNVSVFSVTALAFNDVLGVNQIVTNYTFETAKKSVYEYDRVRVVTDDNKFRVPSTFTYTSVEQPIDSGRMTVLSIDTDSYVSIEEIEVK